MSDQLRGRPDKEAPESASLTARTRLPERESERQRAAPDSSAPSRLSQMDIERPALPSPRLPPNVVGSPNVAEPPALPPITLEALVEQARHLHALPAVVLRVVKMTGEDTASASEIARIIQADPNFAGRILKLANSAQYGLPRNVSRISDAVVLVGMRSVRNFAIAASTHEPMKSELSGYDLSEEDLWRHSLGCAIAAQILAEMARYRDIEEAFVAGLLHDIGKISLNEHVKLQYPLIRAFMKKRDLAFCEAERMSLGFDHAEVGGRIAQKWNLPPRLAQAIAQHHEPMQNGQIAPLVALTHVANAVCLTAGIGLGADGLRARFCVPALSALNLNERHLEKALARLVDEFQQIQFLFGGKRSEKSKSERSEKSKSERSEAA